MTILDRTLPLALILSAVTPALAAQCNEQVFPGAPTAPIGTCVAIENESFRGNAEILAAGSFDRVRIWENDVEQAPWMGLDSVGDVALLPVPASQQTFLAVGEPLFGGRGQVQVQDIRSGATWTVPPSSSRPSGTFGGSVALGLRGGTPIMVAGDSLNNEVHIYAFDALAGWIPEQTLGGASSFGHDVAVYGLDVVVGAPRESTWVFEGGAVHFFHHDGASYQPGYTMDSFWAYSHLGWSVDISKDFAVAGQPGTAGLGPDEGTVVVFERSGSTFSYVWDLSSGESLAGLGVSVAIHTRGFTPFLVAGKPGYGQRRGEASLFHKTGGFWERVTNWRSPVSVGNALFGGSVAISDSFAINQFGGGLAIGAVTDNNYGRIYTYDVPSLPQKNFTGSGTPGYLGQVPTLDSLGGLCSGHRYELWATGRPSSSAVVLFGIPGPPPPVLGVTLHLTPVIALGQAMDSFGRWETTLNIGPGINGQVFLSSQIVILDPDGPLGLSASPALSISH